MNTGFGSTETKGWVARSGPGSNNRDPRQHLQPQVLRLIWPLVCVALLQMALMFVSLEMLSAVRTYVNGESLWSKGIKDAVRFLDLYTESRDENFYRRYQKAVAMPLGDRLARIAMEQPRLDYTTAYTGLLAGGSHPQDIDSAIWLFRYGHKYSYMKRAIDYWRATDEGLLELRHLGDTIRVASRSGPPSQTQLAAWQVQLFAIDEKLAPKAWAFSNALGDASRAVTRMLIWLNLGAGAILILLGFFGTRKLLRERQRAESALAHEQKRAQTTLASIGDAVLTINGGGAIDYMNPAAEKLLGWHGDEANGKPLESLFRLFDEQIEDDRLDLAKALLHGKADASFGGTHQLERTDGSRVPVSLVGTPLATDETVSGAVVVLHDMTRERQYVAKLSWQASHDALTSLFNRREFDRRLERLLTRLEEQGGQHGLIYVDLDQFKIVNDTCGHAAGDQLLCQVANQLQTCLRDSDTLARLGGDEFGVLLENCPIEPAIIIAEKLRQVVEELHFTAVDGRHFTIGASIGLVCLEPSQFGLVEALRAADMACYLAKEKGRNRVQVYNAEDSDLSSRFGEMVWVQRINQALKEEQFCLYAQEFVRINAREAEGVCVELLLRLRDESGRIVLPDEFMPAAERFGLMPQIDRWVVQNAFATLVQRKRCGAPPIANCAINLSGATIGDEGFLIFLRNQFAEHEIPPQSISFEVTETIAIANLDSAIRFIRELQALGCRFALDDFGSGMSSFGYLKHLPVDLLKIDGSFVKGMLEDPIDYAMVEMISRLAHLMGKETVAEAIETREVFEALGKIGVDFAQGYAIAKPVPFFVPSVDQAE